MRTLTKFVEPRFSTNPRNVFSNSPRRGARRYCQREQCWLVRGVAQTKLTRCWVLWFTQHLRSVVELALDSAPVWWWAGSTHVRLQTAAVTHNQTSHPPISPTRRGRQTPSSQLTSSAWWLLNACLIENYADAILARFGWRVKDPQDEICSQTIL